VAQDAQLAAAFRTLRPANVCFCPRWPSALVHEPTFATVGCRRRGRRSKRPQPLTVRPRRRATRGYWVPRHRTQGRSSG
jgi:hypothetical protein